VTWSQVALTECWYSQLSSTLTPSAGGGGKGNPWKKKRLWTPRIGEGLVVKQERDNRHNKYAVAVIKDGILALLAMYQEKSARMFTIS